MVIYIAVYKNMKVLTGCIYRPYNSHHRCVMRPHMNYRSQIIFMIHHKCVMKLFHHSEHTQWFQQHCDTVSL